MKQNTLNKIFISLGYYKYSKEDPMFNNTKFPDLYTDSTNDANYKCYWSLGKNSSYLCIQKENIEEFEKNNVVIEPNNKMIFGVNTDISIYNIYRQKLNDAIDLNLINEKNVKSMEDALIKIYHDLEKSYARKREK